MHGVIHSQVASQPAPEKETRSAIGFAFLPLAVLIAMAAIISGGAVTPSP